MMHPQTGYSGLNYSLADSIFSGPITSIFSAVCVDEKLFHMPVRNKKTKKKKKLKVFKISRFYWSFLDGIMPVKGLIAG